jgi:hypothetical protein
MVASGYRTARWSAASGISDRTDQNQPMSEAFGRTTQNSFPSGSARTVYDSLPVCPMSTRLAPSVSSRLISASRFSAVLIVAVAVGPAHLFVTSR